MPCSRRNSWSFRFRPEDKDRTGQRANAYLLADEAQAVIAQNIAQVLDLARSYGLAFLMAHQSMSQLNQAGGVEPSNPSLQ